MTKRIVKAEISEVYNKLKTFLIANKCKIIAEETSKTLSVVQGSVWGTSPKNAQKKIIYMLIQYTEGTQVTATSVLTAGYINLTLAGCVFSLALLVICAWIVLNLQAYPSTGMVGIWGWLAQTQGYFNAEKASVLIRLMEILAAFLLATLFLEAGIIWNVRRKIDVFAEDALRAIA